jgi:hypothetical protein
VSAASLVSSRSLINVQQCASHAALCQDVSGVLAPRVGSRSGLLDAIIVPASRPASYLQPAIDLAARLGILLVVLCSKQTKDEQVADRVWSSPGARALVIEIPEQWSHPNFPSQTSSRVFRAANANRQSDLSAKRNIGLLLARLHGWNKIIFLDDDITLSGTDNLARFSSLVRPPIASFPVWVTPCNLNMIHMQGLSGLDVRSLGTCWPRACMP